ncbi:MAG: ergothioneine biosynthesis protein EgtB [Phycisphaeraceae bacterium]
MTTLAAPAVSKPTRRLLDRFNRSRAVTHRLAQPLSREDMVVQTTTDVSPTKWHLAHTTWFYERFVLRRFVDRYEPFHEQYEYLFNSYYDTVGPQHCRAERGLVSRPSVDEVFAYRKEVDRRVAELIETNDADRFDELAMLIELGVQHEQQHQELIATDIKHVLSSNPLLPAYHMGDEADKADRSTGRSPGEPRWRRFDEGVYEIGYHGQASFDAFCFDNETPRHRVYLHGFELADRLVTNGEYLAFVDDGGYDRPELWLSMGFATIHEQRWRHPLYWYRDSDRWMHYTLRGPREVDPAEPVSHLSYFEADAFARWAKARLPREAEWEVAAADHPVEGPHQDAWQLHPEPLSKAAAAGGTGKDARKGNSNGDKDEDATPLHQLYGNLWQWTLSQYEPYPGYHPLPGSLGEYNGKFMCNQFVLRGSSCATPADHARLTYRNFLPPDARWQFTGLRLARDA